MCFWDCILYLSNMSLLFIRHGLFLSVATSFFFSSTSSLRAAISPSDRDSSSESEEEEELMKGKNSHVPWLFFFATTTIS